MDKVVAITVTYNDYEYLIKSLDALRSQSIPIYKIVVVDNASNEDIRKKLKCWADEQIEILWLDENRGGAGGFEEGMRYSHVKYDPDWYWLMDADAYPRKDCAERLLEQKNYCDDIGILAPLIYGIDLNEYQLYHHKKESKFLFRDRPIFCTYEEVPLISSIEADAFVGTMVSKCVVQDVGFVDGQLFIYGDDVEYTYRVSRKHKVLLIRNAIMNHRDQPVNGEQKPVNWWKDYYTFRNRILFVREYRKNRMYELVGIAMLHLRVFKQLLKNMVAPYNFEMKKYRYQLLCRALADGMDGKKGKTVDPMLARAKVVEMEKKSISR